MGRKFERKSEYKKHVLTIIVERHPFEIFSVSGRIGVNQPPFCYKENVERENLEQSIEEVDSILKQEIDGLSNLNTQLTNLGFKPSSQNINS